MSESTTEGTTDTSEEAITSSLLPPIPPVSHGNPFASMKPNLSRKGTSNSSDSGSSCNDNNASDNSALVSIGNNSFGFNFPNESSNGSDSEGGSGGQDNPPSNRPPAVSGSSSSNSNGNSSDDRPSFVRASRDSNHHTCGGSPTNSDSSSSSKSNDRPPQEVSGVKEGMPSVTLNRKISPEESAAMLKTIASTCVPGEAAPQPMAPISQAIKRSSKDFEDVSEEEGYNTDNDDDDDQSDGHQSKKSRSQGSLDGEPRPGRRRSKKGNDKRREERNAREKERSFRIAKQINELRDLLSAGGVILPKGTKSSVLTEAANYIRLLQQHQLRSEV
jgi:Helix-loop-helix DNA-binding domain